MSLVVNHNLMAANVARNLNTHYGKLAQSTQRLSTGLRVNSAADDAAGLAIRELQRADIAAYHQGARNANDAISMIQTADGALAIIDEKLIRMKELAEQAATGTYDSTQRLMIDSEFQAMAAEIDRIANATDFNGIHLLNGNLSGKHDGSGLNSTGAMKIHFGSGNDSAEDYYYVEIERCDIVGLGLGGPVKIESVIDNSMFPPDSDYGSWNVTREDISYVKNYITDISDNSIQINGVTYTGHVDSLGKFTHGGDTILGKYMDNGIVISSGKASDLKGYPGDDLNLIKNNYMGQLGDSDLDSLVGNSTKDASSIEIKFTSNQENLYFNVVFASEEYEKYVHDLYNDVAGIFLDGVNYAFLDNLKSIDGVDVSGYSGPLSLNTLFTDATLYIDNRNQNNLFAANGLTHTLRFEIPITDTNEHTLKFAVADREDEGWDSWFLINGISGSKEFSESTSPEFQYTSEAIHIDTQEKAQHALSKINDAIVIKDKIRANLGALQNRLENTITNITTQAENLQAAESRISDVDVATEMTEFVRQQILAQSAVAMLSQANSMPQMAMQLIGG